MTVKRENGSSVCHCVETCGDKLVLGRTPWVLNRIVRGYPMFHNSVSQKKTFELFGSQTNLDVNLRVLPKMNLISILWCSESFTGYSIVAK